MSVPAILNNSVFPVCYLQTYKEAWEISEIIQPCK